MKVCLPKVNSFLKKKIKKSNGLARVKSFLNAVVMSELFPLKNSMSLCSTSFGRFWFVIKLFFIFVFLPVVCFFFQPNILWAFKIKNQRAKACIWLYLLWLCHQGFYAPKDHTFQLLFPLPAFADAKGQCNPREIILSDKIRKKELYLPWETVPTLSRLGIWCSRPPFQFYRLFGVEQ